MTLRKGFRFFLKTGLISFVLLNAICFMHAYRFTHFKNAKANRPADIQSISVLKKIEMMLLGVANNKPLNNRLPQIHYQPVSIQKDNQAWWIPHQAAKGNMILFHGFKGSKSGMLNRALLFNQMGYNTLVVDLMGSGEDKRNKTSLGYFEAAQVKACFNWVDSVNEKPTFLLGHSMGAASVMRAVAELKVNPSGVILESPYYSLCNTTKARFKAMGLPPTPLAHLLLFWGGVQQGFNPFGLKPIQYASKINCKSLLLFGDQDYSISNKESRAITAQMKGLKKRVVFKGAGHTDFLFSNLQLYQKSISDFLKQKKGEST